MQSLLNYALGLVLTGLAGYGAFGAYVTAMDGQHIETLQAQISSIQKNIINQYKNVSGGYSFGILPVTTMIGRKIVQKSAVSADFIENPFNGTYSVIGNDGGGATPITTFSVVADNIPELDCEQIIKSFVTGGGLTGGSLYGYATSKSLNGGGTIHAVLPDRDTNAQANCAAPGSATVAIQFIFNG